MMDEERIDLATEIVERELAAGGVAALARVYEKAFAQLAPVIGDNGVRGIFARALELARKEHAELQSFVLVDEPYAIAPELARCFARVPRDDARHAAVALYTRFFELIVAFVGCELAVRLLHVAWPHLALARPQT